MSQLIVSKRNVQEGCEGFIVLPGMEILQMRLCKAGRGVACTPSHLSSHIIRGALEGNFSAQPVGLRQRPTHAAYILYFINHVLINLLGVALERFI